MLMTASVQIKRVRIVMMSIVCFQVIAFFGPRIFSELDRWGYGSIKLTYGLVATDLLSMIVVMMHLILIQMTWIALHSSCSKLLEHKVNFRNVMLGVVFVLPIFIFGADSGYFWTVPLLYSSLFLIIPNLVHYKHRMLGIVILAMLFSLSGSKAGVVYILIITYIYWPQKIVVKNVLLAFLAFVSMLLLTVYVRGEWADLAIMPYYLLWREYSWEMTGLALYYYQNMPSIPYSVILNALISLIPNSLVDAKVQVTHAIPAIIAVADVNMVPNAGFYLSYFLLFILDLGLLGIPLAYFLYWQLLRVCVDKINKSNGISHCLPFLVYLHYLLNGELAFYLSHAIFGSAAISLGKMVCGPKSRMDG